MWCAGMVIMLLLATPSLSAWAPLYRSPGKVPGSYIVVLKSDVDLSEVTSSMSSISSEAGVVFDITHKFLTVLNGFSVTLGDSRALDIIRSHDAVRYVEEDGMAYADDVTWGLDRIDQRDLPLDDTFQPSGDGDGAHVYILDTGLRTTHQEFEDRATFAYDATGSEMGNGTDCNGHGTHCAGTAAGAQYGVAPRSKVYGVKVLGCTGSGSWSGIIDGMDWVATNGKRPAVASMSLSGVATFSAVDEAVEALVQSGVTLTVSAGNNDYDACYRVPARAQDAITVGATGSDDTRAYFSNFGGCVNIFAPGLYITSAGIGYDSEYTVKSGTSMSTPHVAGAAALYLAKTPDLTPLEVRTILANTATRDKVKDTMGTPNLLLYV
ncbi:aqualysin-1-like [Diadema antillarum]|uniref:aqualysin-1-like n=1 Tax=Diadema antillarum TaxID=105358 RepID=UPI003A8459F4